MRSLLLLFPITLLIAQPPVRLQPGYDSIQLSHLQADLTFLSSDALEGRRSLERGSEVAIQWIASEFAKAGLKPAACCDGSIVTRGDSQNELCSNYRAYSRRDGRPRSRAPRSLLATAGVS